MFIRKLKDLRRHPVTKFEYAEMSDYSEELLEYIVNVLALSSNKG